MVITLIFFFFFLTNLSWEDPTKGVQCTVCGDQITHKEKGKHTRKEWWYSYRTRDGYCKDCIKTKTCKFYLSVLKYSFFVLTLLPPFFIFYRRGKGVEFEWVFVRGKLQIYIYLPCKITKTKGKSGVRRFKFEKILGQWTG
jgi:hypothetical protein